MPQTKISEFQGQFRFLSNFWPAPVTLDGVLYPSVEHAYQAAKSIDPHVRALFTSGPAGSAKRTGRSIKIRADWNSVKLSIMERLVEQKFTNHPALQEQLLATGDCLLEEGNNWGDRYWGVCNGTGHNHLGRILMRVRSNLQPM